MGAVVRLPERYGWRMFQLHLFVRPPFRDVQSQMRTGIALYDSGEPRSAPRTKRHLGRVFIVVRPPASGTPVNPRDRGSVELLRRTAFVCTVRGARVPITFSAGVRCLGRSEDLGQVAHREISKMPSRVNRCPPHATYRWKIGLVSCVSQRTDCVGTKTGT
jgi:hypothetical protein